MLEHMAGWLVGFGWYPSQVLLGLVLVGIGHKSFLHRLLLGTDQPTNQPTNRPTNQPTNRPTNQPSNQPTFNQPKFEFEFEFEFESLRV
jgi:hypothetical protein